MAAALARVFEDDRGTDTLIICPKHLVEMWEAYVADFRLRAKVLSLGKVDDLTDMRRYRVVLIDESQNLRNREGKRYKLIQDYISRNDCFCILLSATPYNKTYLDLSSQLRLFVPESQDLGIRPERLLREIGETEFIRRHQAPVRSLAAFEKSEFPDDWRDPDETLPRAANSQLHQDQLRKRRPRWSIVPHVRERDALLLSRAPAPYTQVHDRRRRSRGSLRSSLFRRERQRNQPSQPTPLRTR